MHKEERLSPLDEISDVQGHLIDLRVVELFNISQHPHIVCSDEVDGDTLPSESSSTTNSVNVVLSV